ARERTLTRRDLAARSHPRYSNTLTTRATPSVVAATSPAASPSGFDTRPIRYTTERSVTTFTALGGNLFASTMRALTLDVMYESLLRACRLVGAPTTSSLCTTRTFSVVLAILPTLAHAPWSGTSPVSSTTPL